MDCLSLGSMLDNGQKMNVCDFRLENPEKEFLLKLQGELPNVEEFFNRTGFVTNFEFAGSISVSDKMFASLKYSSSGSNLSDMSFQKTLTFLYENNFTFRINNWPFILSKTEYSRIQQNIENNFNTTHLSLSNNIPFNSFSTLSFTFDNLIVSFDVN